MSEEGSRWILLEAKNREALNKATLQLHQASQFLAAIGNSFLPHQKDDAHTNLGWGKDRSLYSRSFGAENQFSLKLVYEAFKLVLEGSSNGPEEIEFGAKDKDFISSSLVKILENIGFAADSFQAISHYKLPAHDLDSGALFQKADPEI